MGSSNRGAEVLLATGTLFALAACGGSRSVPAAPFAAGNGASQVSANASDLSPDDGTSVLKKLSKNVVIGSTVDPKNGDKGPRGVALVKSTYGLKKGQLMVCNFENSSGAAGKGTTIEKFNPQPGSKAVAFAQNSKLQGCAGVAVSNNNSVYAAGATSGSLVSFDKAGKLLKAYGSPFKMPFYVAEASNSNFYAAEYMFTTDAATGAVVSFSVNMYGNPHPLEVIGGFAKNSKSGWARLGPSGASYSPKKDTLYVADGVDNTVVSFDHASELLVKDEVVVKPGGKTFQCKYPSTTCGKLVYSGKPLDAPVAMTLLPNGNLIVANSGGGNTLVEMTPGGTILDTKVVDKSKTAGVFGLRATGKTDSDTALYYTDANDNSLHKLEQ